MLRPPLLVATRVRKLAIAIPFALVIAGCYAEVPPPPTFRYACEADGDCDDPERCIRGRCEIPCSSSQDPICSDNGMVACFQGLCTSLCTIGGKDQCSEPSACLFTGADLSGGGGFGGSTEDLGLCGSRCTGDNGVCPESEYCLDEPLIDAFLAMLPSGAEEFDMSLLDPVLGLCLPRCPDGTDEECGTGFDCRAGLCIFESFTMDMPESDATGGETPEGSGSPENE